MRLSEFIFLIQPDVVLNGETLKRVSHLNVYNSSSIDSIRSVKTSLRKVDKAEKKLNKQKQKTGEAFDLFGD
jgi:hypothetical protein